VFCQYIVWLFYTDWCRGACMRLKWLKLREILTTLIHQIYMTKTMDMAKSKKFLRFSFIIIIQTVSKVISGNSGGLCAVDVAYDQTTLAAG